MRIFGFRLRRFGTPLPDPAMFVANHVSWVDIEMLHSQRMMGFVAKQEIRGWPLVGWLTARGETIFHQRGSQESMGGVMHAMLARLQAGRPVGVFPEGRTRDGSEVGPFHARIFQPAVRSGRAGAAGGAALRPARQCADRWWRSAPVKVSSPISCACSANRARSADICFLAPIAAGELEGRSKIAELARERIVAAMGADRLMAFGSNAPNHASMLAPMLTADDYHPPKWLHNPHLQSVLSSSGLRRRRGLRALNATGAVTTEHIFDGGDGVRLQGWHSAVPGKTSSGLALLLHGWEGSTESSYMRMTAARLLEAGFEVVRLNFRDHGDTHHLNEEIFHSNRLDEVVNAAVDVARRFPQPAGSWPPVIRWAEISCCAWPCARRRRACRWCGWRRCARCWILRPR